MTRTIAPLEPGLAEALVRLLAHDLREPLGPLALAVSSITDDPEATDDMRWLAREAELQAARIGRMIDAAIAATRGARAPGSERVNLIAVLKDVAAGYEALGGTADVHGEPLVVAGDHRALRDALLGIVEVAGGEGGSVRIEGTEYVGMARVIIRGDETALLARARLERGPCDRPSTLALGAAAVLAGHAGTLETTPDRAVVLLPLVDR